MISSNVPDPELLKTLLDPLLDDFQYWLSRAQVLLSNEDIQFLSAEARTDLLTRVDQALQEVNATHSLFKATGSQVGVDTTVMMKWHHLVAECWQVMIRFRLGQTPASESDKQVSND
ncbi:MAG TPA: DUF2605 domain-containing protein [Stenomitos sp.]